MIHNSIQNLIDYAIKNNLITEDDIYVVRNNFIEALNLDNWEETTSSFTNETIDEILNPIIDYACEQGIITDTVNSRDLFDTKLMGFLTPMPREIISEFSTLYEISPKEATDWYYDYSCKLNYVRAERIKKDLRWVYSTEYGDLDITINCSKPEKDPRDIAAAKRESSTRYPKCQLCPENAGFSGTLNHPARQNLRPIPLTVANQKWQMQYSPYGYYNEHCIVFNTEHTPMKIDASVFGKLFDIIDYLPHYFIGSNADLPIVGGSILSHEHFQGGRYTFAMEKAKIETEFTIPAYQSVKAGIVKWPMSVIRLSSPSKDELSKCCNYILQKWKSYTDDSAFIFAKTDGTEHNTVTPIARKSGDNYVCDIVLRNNFTTKDRPLGLFHPNPSLHHIKKENIGLIEVMGLAVLPARLAKEIKALEKAIVEKSDLFSIPELSSHAIWINEIIQKYPDITPENAPHIIKQEIGAVFLEVLCDAGVFKRTADGKQAFMRFISSLIED